MTISYAPVKQSASVIYLDQTTDQALIHSADLITRDADIAQFGMVAMSKNLLTAQQLATKALVLSNNVLANTPHTERSQEYVQELTHDFLQQLIELTSAANIAIKSRCLSGTVYDHR
jgi:hypothetical protein